MAECLIGGIHIDTSTAEGQNIYVGLPNGVTLQQSLMEDVESIYGAPKDRYEADTSVQFTYEYGLYQTITLGFDNETGILYSLDMQNFTTTADAEALDGVSDATTPEVEAYQHRKPTAVKSTTGPSALTMYSIIFPFRSVNFWTTAGPSIRESPIRPF